MKHHREGRVPCPACKRERDALRAPEGAQGRVLSRHLARADEYTAEGPTILGFCTGSLQPVVDAPTRGAPARRGMRP